jgi:hypothetical protein
LDPLAAESKFQQWPLTVVPPLNASPSLPIKADQAPAPLPPLQSSPFRALPLLAMKFAARRVAAAAPEPRRPRLVVRIHAEADNHHCPCSVVPLPARRTPSAECKTDMSAVLTVKSNLDPHMIIELKDGK